MVNRDVGINILEYDGGGVVSFNMQDLSVHHTYGHHPLDGP